MIPYLNIHKIRVSLFFDIKIKFTIDFFKYMLYNKDTKNNFIVYIFCPIRVCVFITLHLLNRELGSCDGLQTSRFLTDEGSMKS